MKNKRNNIDVYQLICNKTNEKLKEVGDLFKNDLESLKKAVTYVTSTAKHSADLHKNVEKIVSLESFGDEFPHDIGGKANKFEIKLIEVMMLEKLTSGNRKKGKPIFTKNEEKILLSHTKIQRHHKVNESEDFSKDDIAIWAADIILGLREMRSYKTSWSFNDVKKYLASLDYSQKKKKALKKALKIQYNNERLNLITNWGN